MCDSSHVAHITLWHDSTAQSLCLKYKHDRSRSIGCIWHLLFLEGRRVDSTRDEPRDDLEGLPKTLANDRADISFITRVWLSHHNFMHFLQSGFNEQSNQRDMRQTITKRRQCLSDGLNVTDLRAAVCEGQAWYAAEQRGPRADPQSRLGNWLDSPDTSPLCSAATLTWNTHRLHQQQLAYFHPFSRCLSPSKCMGLFISLHIFACKGRDCLFSVSFSMTCAHFLLSFISLPFWPHSYSPFVSSPSTSTIWLHIP